MPFTFSEFLDGYTNFRKNAQSIKLEWDQIEMVNKMVRDQFEFDDRVRVYDVINKYLLSDKEKVRKYKRTLEQNRRPTEAELKRLRGDILYEIMDTAWELKRTKNFPPLSSAPELTDAQVDSLLARNDRISAKCNYCKSLLGQYRANLVCGHVLCQKCVEKLVRKFADCPICRKVV